MVDSGGRVSYFYRCAAMGNGGGWSMQNGRPICHIRRNMTGDGMFKHNHRLYRPCKLYRKYCIEAHNVPTQIKGQPENQRANAALAGSQGTETPGRAGAAIPLRTARNTAADHRGGLRLRADSSA